uniref:non-specific serine/threonine protein kinase n=1 Tax=Heterorhabditis bacteriophora TaxID=37862 RepID=A0A1I7X249_HETBA
MTNCSARGIITLKMMCGIVVTPRDGDLEDLITPRASTYDVRDEPDQPQSLSMTSSIVVERSMKPLMEDLAKAMGDSTALPLGIRHIFTIDGQLRVTDIDQFEDGESYVCSSTEVFKSLDYANAKEPFWCFTLSRTSRPNDAALLGLTFNEPVTVNFFKLISVTSLHDFFREEDVFIAYGNERTSADDFFVISEEYKRLYSGGRRSLTTRRRVMPARNESLREDRCGSVIPDELARHLPAELDDKFSIIKLLGDGNTALVYEVVDRQTLEHKALKFIARENAIGKEALINSELTIMSKLEHPFVVQMYDSWKLAGSYYLSLELVDGGDLFEHLCAVRRLSERQAARLTKGLGEALRYLINNIILTLLFVCLLSYNAKSLLQLKVADFGLATELPDGGQRLTVICGTPTYVAAEVLTEMGYDEKVDIWATGVILYVMLCGFPPFQRLRYLYWICASESRIENKVRAWIHDVNELYLNLFYYIKIHIYIML